MTQIILESQASIDLPMQYLTKEIDHHILSKGIATFLYVSKSELKAISSFVSFISEVNSEGEKNYPIVCTNDICSNYTGELETQFS